VVALRAQNRDPRLDRLAPAIRDQVAAVVDSARRDALPTLPLIEKALEGTSKRASDQAILTVVRAVADALRVARAALGAQCTPDELAAAAVALRAGARAADLAALRAARPTQNLAVPLGVLSDLVARGVPADTAARIMRALAVTHARDEDYVVLRRRVDRDIDLGVPPISSAFRQLNASARAALLEPAKKP